MMSDSQCSVDYNRLSNEPCESVLAAQSCPTLCESRNINHQALASMEFSRQEYRSGLPFPSPGDLLHTGMEPGSPTLQADSLPSEPPGKVGYYSGV